MAQSGVELLRAMYPAFASLAQGADVVAYVRAFYDPEVEYHPVDEAGFVRGHDELISWNSRWFEAWTRFDVHIDEIVETDGKFVTGITVLGRGRESDVDISQRIFHVCELRDGKILRMHEYVDRDEALSSAAHRP